MTRIELDFETHYTGEYSVKKLGHALYARDPRFKCTMAAAWSPSMKVSTTPDRFPWDALDGKEIVVHNAAFDRAVFRRLQSDGIVPACIKPKIWLDSAAACAYFGLPRDLAGAVKALFGATVDKSVRDRMAGYQADLFDDTAAYAIIDAEWSWRLWERLGHKWPEAERRIHALTDEMGDRGVCLDETRAKAAIASLDASIAGLEASIHFRPIASAKALKKACEAAGEPVPPGTAAADPKVETWCRENQKANSPLWVRQVQGWRKANRTREVVRSMLDRVDPATGRMQYQLKYFGAAQTGRWSGGGGLNVQNFNRKEGAAGVDLRSLLVPAPGCAFVIADYAQVEARVLLWLAGDYDFLDLLRGGMDLYEAAARKMLGYSDPRPIKAINPRPAATGEGHDPRPRLRHVRRQVRVRRQDPRRPRSRLPRRLQAPRRDLPPDEPPVVALWNRLGDAFEKRHGKPHYVLKLHRPRHPLLGTLVRRGHVLRHGRAGRATPSSRLLAENHAGDRPRPAGRRLAAAADAGIRIVLSVHDELVAECPAADAPAVKAEMERIMRTPGVPMAEAHPSRRRGTRRAEVREMSVLHTPPAPRSFLANPPETGGGRHEWLFTVQAQLVRQGFAPTRSRPPWKPTAAPPAGTTACPRSPATPPPSARTPMLELPPTASHGPPWTTPSASSGTRSPRCSPRPTRAFPPPTPSAPSSPRPSGSAPRPIVSAPAPTASMTSCPPPTSSSSSSPTPCPAKPAAPAPAANPPAPRTTLAASTAAASP